MVVFKNPRGVKNPSAKTIKNHTFTCENCNNAFISLNSVKDRFCTRECASQYRKSSGWTPSEETRRKMSEANKGREFSKETLEKMRKVGIDKASLTQVYFEEGKTQKECAVLFECSPTTISRYLKEYDLVDKKGNREAQTTGTDNDGRYTDKDWFYQKYFVEKKTVSKIASICSAGKTTIKRWLKRHGFDARDRSECQKGIKRSKEFCEAQSKRVRGKDNPFYGKTHTPETMNKIMERKTHYPYQGGMVKWYRHTRSDGKEVKLQGTWEFETARFLDDMGEVYSVHGEFPGLSYKVGSGTRTYFPDFYLPAHDIYLEVKGYFTDKMRDKISRVIEEHNVKVEVWQEADLLDLGILLDGYKYLVKKGHYAKYLIKTKQK